MKTSFKLESGIFAYRLIGHFSCAPNNKADAPIHTKLPLLYICKATGLGLGGYRGTGYLIVYPERKCYYFRTKDPQMDLEIKKITEPLYEGNTHICIKKDIIKSSWTQFTTTDNKKIPLIIE